MTVQQYSQFIAGVDEVGRGPLAGPVIAAAVILDPDNQIDGLRDSKKLTEKRRQQLSVIIQERAASFAFGRAEVEEIDELNILHASLLAMQRAVLALHIQPDHALVDGNRAPALSCSVTTIIKGDDKEDAIAAASIIAKVKRDQEMLDLHQSFPDYGFDRHKGYPTRLHIQALQQHGVTIHHRRSFRPVREALSGN
ncbi:MAG: ribonuclease HII [Gammaproteobacteria bacterium]|nr:ribonuclease HII [Gammaproteobacteria bacterium]